MLTGARLGELLGLQWKHVEARTETARALQPEHDGRCLHAYISRRRSKCCARFRRGDLWRSVPSCSKFWNMEQEHGIEQGNSCTRLSPHLEESGRLAGGNRGGFWLRGPATIRIV